MEPPPQVNKWAGLRLPLREHLRDSGTFSRVLVSLFVLTGRSWTQSCDPGGHLCTDPPTTLPDSVPMSTEVEK